MKKFLETFSGGGGGGGNATGGGGGGRGRGNVTGNAARGLAFDQGVRAAGGRTPGRRPTRRGLPRGSRAM